MTYVVLDTNVYVHCTHFTQLNFAALLGCRDVTLLLPEIVLKELDDIKDSHQTKKVKQRIRQIVATLQNFFLGSDSEIIQIRDGLSIRMISDPSSELLDRFSLDCKKSDHRLIGSMLTFQETAINGGDKLVLVSRDTINLITAKNKKLSFVRLADDYLVRDEPDVREKEIEVLTHKLSKYENAIPKLILSVDRATDSFVRLTVKRVSHVQPMPAEKIPASTNEPPPSTNGRNSLSLALHSSLYGVVDPQEQIRYKKQSEQYPNDYAAYVKQVKLYNDTCFAKFQLCLINKGTVPSKDIDVYVHFPDGFTMYSLEEDEDELCYLHPPVAPKIPDSPQSAIQQLIGRARSPMAITDFRIPNFNANCSSELKHTHSYDFTSSIRYLKHGLMSREQIANLLLVFRSASAAKHFQADYRISAANIPEEVTGKLNFVFNVEAVPQLRQDKT